MVGRMYYPGVKRNTHADLLYSAVMVGIGEQCFVFGYPNGDVAAALLEGCKVPNFDWEMARAIAISELVSDNINLAVA
jgi:hypothetical protein